MIMHGTDINLLYTHDCSRCGIYLVANSIYLSPQLPTALVYIYGGGGGGGERERDL